jgi:hypothetical protein
MVILKSTHEYAERAWAQLRKLNIPHDKNCVPLKVGGFGFAITDDEALRLQREGIAEFTGTPPLLTVIFGK